MVSAHCHVILVDYLTLRHVMLGACHLVMEHKASPPEEVYVRCAEEHDIPGEGNFKLVICMFKAMSNLLIATKCPSIDTSFKCLHKWQEFEIEAWFPEFMCCEHTPATPDKIYL